jgi:DNA-binding protein H-NS
MASYKELQAQIAELQIKAEEARINEIQEALKRIKELMDQYGISAAEVLGQKRGNKKNFEKKKIAAQFQDGDKTWSGRGREPNWLKGKEKEKFRVR